MRKEYENFFTNFEQQEPPKDLFGRIILAIKREQESRRTKRLLFGFLTLLLTSLIAAPLSGAMLASQVESSGLSYFISAAISDLGTFFVLWPDFGLAMLESLPLMGILAFTISLGISIFTLRLFLHRRSMLFKYLMQSFA
ncbi:hypothetical protein KKC83_02240 [Patescibacteria group bacterium]|nr:hypothetical protein [Patescibacteria group bacterium]MCG2698109.1 hypothetical protein [Candidatus Parcubacteria bacterium]MBU4015592.1 hypothetical protein [Patescibacteria group bacterium]MBU4026344.1 hypothetical protein [Patescibacteria group bacterium]MBU4073207.1 hypothetical protein [Patescibacteria group bacterium]